MKNKIREIIQKEFGSEPESFEQEAEGLKHET